VSLETLRAQIRALEGGARVQRRRVSSGVQAFDELVQGLPCPGIVELCGPDGSGRTRLALELVATATRSRRSVAWVDPLRQLYPPAAAALGVDLDRLLIVRPSADGSHPEIWATEQLLRSGCFSLVVSHLPEQRGARRFGGHQWARAAERGQCTALVLGARPQRDVPAEVRLQTGGGRVAVLRDRGGRPGSSLDLPSYAPATDPWGTGD
jgi:recombination protein RecA